MSTQTADLLRSPLTSLSEDERLFKDSVFAFADREVRPLVREMDEHAKMPASLLKQLFDLGVMGIEVPETYGGGGGTFFHSVLAVEALSRVDPSIGVVVDVQNTLVINALLRWATDDQKQRFLPRLAADTIGAYALSEAGSGSDAFAMTTRAARSGDDWVISGRKLWITNGNEAGLFIVFANINPEAGYKGITAFLVERDTPGFTVGKKEDKLGIRASSTCELLFEQCRVPAGNVLGEVGKGYKAAIETLNEGRIGIGAQMVGLAQGALDHAIRYTSERRQFGKAIAEFQAVQHQLARAATDVHAARLLVYEAARLRDAKAPFLTEAAMCKLVSSEVAERVASLAINLFGGYGFVKDYPVEKLYRDAKIGQIYEGTSNLQLQTIAKQILGAEVVNATYLTDIRRSYRNYRKLAEAALAQVSDEQMPLALDAEDNSIAVIMKHVAGNLRSRFAGFLNEDGEKPDRNRDAEFEADAHFDRTALMANWNSAWDSVLAQLDALTPEDLERTIHIRHEPFAVTEALNRSVTHTAYHVGQIVFLAKHLAGASWTSLTIPKGKSNDFSTGMFKQHGLTTKTESPGR